MVSRGRSGVHPAARRERVTTPRICRQVFRLELEQSESIVQTDDLTVFG